MHVLPDSFTIYVHPFSKTDTFRRTKNKTHPTVWCTNDIATIFNLIMFEAGNCRKTKLGIYLMTAWSESMSHTLATS